MGAGTGISWADSTWNPIIGCTKVSAGCKNCYAERDFDRRKGFVEWGPDGSRVMTSASNWGHLAKWNKMARNGACLGCLRYPKGSGECDTCGGSGRVDRRQTVFVASLADVFEAWDGPIYGRNRKLFPDDTPLWFQQEGRWETVLEQSLAEKITGTRAITYDDVRARLWDHIEKCPNLIFLVLTKRPENILSMTEGRYFPNVMFGTSIEDQHWAAERLPHLHAARVRCGSGLFVSCEPLVGPVDLGLDGQYPQQLDWVITGGESGNDARPAQTNWFRMLRDQCQEYGGVPFHFKQWGEWAPLSLGIERPHNSPAARYATMMGSIVDYMPFRPPNAYGPMEGFVYVGKAAAGRELDGKVHDALPGCVYQKPRQYETI